MGYVLLFALIFGAIFSTRVLLDSSYEEGMSEKRKAAIQAARTPVKIYEADGCAIYRFSDENRYHYFRECGKNKTQMVETVGK